ncbi:hypothetical protein Taro_016599 [Colocasia esculenta]|uniref:Glycosyltransferases n=1 Tax=Colocasia esculenta TaxID=4460 RepID=A0A843UE60_COLES|nr:hypothetical protein [Colocasia esculenta]
MASIRRTLSPARDLARQAQQDHSFLPHSQQQQQQQQQQQPPSHRSSPLSLSSSSSSTPPQRSPPHHSLIAEIRRFMAGGALFPQRQPILPQAARRWAQQQPPWRRPLMRFSLCFVLGFLLGFSPFSHLDGMKPLDLPSYEIGTPFPYRGVGEGDAAAVVQRDLLEKGIVPVIERSNPSDQVSKPGDGEIVSSEPGGKGEEGVEATPLPGKLLIVVTPTYNRAFQAFYLTRLGQALRLVRAPLLWIVVEMETASVETAELLRRTGVMYRHLVCEKKLSETKDRGVYQRNTALEHIERHKLEGIVYFADDDNIYTTKLFEQIREIRRFGTWPVAMLSQSKNKATLEGPVCNGSQVIGWHTNEKSKQLRRFHVDMSGFAFNSSILWDSKRWRRPTSDSIRQLDTVKEGFQETTFIEQIVEDENQMEGIPHGCSEIMDWHIHLEAQGLFYPRGWRLAKNLEVVIPIK